MKRKRLFLLLCTGLLFLPYFLVRLGANPQTLVEALSIWDWLILAYLTLFSLYFHVFLHELGHLIGGKLTGYRLVFFQSSRLRYDSKTRSFTRKRPRGAGMLGQCLMAPPEAGSYEEKPYWLYLVGGLVMNFLWGGLLYAGSFLLPVRWSFYAFVLCLVPFLLGLSNSYWRGYTDGNVIKEVRTSPLARKLFFQQLELAERFEQDQTFTDIPERFFESVYSGESEKTFLGEYYELIDYRRKLYELDFEAADLRLRRVMAARDTRFSPYAVSIYCEKLFCDSLFGRIKTARQTRTLVQRIPQLAAHYRQTKRIAAAYELFVNVDVERAKELLAQGVDLHDLSLADQLTEKRLEEWLGSFLPPESGVLGQG